jgi:hypothetical protein
MLEDASKQTTDWVAGAGVLLAGVALGVGVVMAPVAAIVGGGIGAASAPSEADIAAAEQSMTKALEGAKPADAVRAQVTALARERAGLHLYDCVGVSSFDACRKQSPEPVAAVLTIQVRPPYFEVEGSVAPRLRLLLSARAEVFRTNDPTTVYSRAWVYRGPQYGYFDLAADDAAKFRADLATAENALAEKIVDDLWIGSREEVHASAEQPEGTVWTISAGLISREAGRP